jgi:hypothetical protein
MTRRTPFMHTYRRRSRFSYGRDVVAPLVFTAALGIMTVGCDSNSEADSPSVPTSPTPPPSSPSPPATAPQLTGITVDPGGVGIQHATTFSFGLTGQTGTDSAIAWTSDGNGVNASGATATHTFTQAGLFTVRAEARNASGTSAVTRAVEIKALAGLWEGTIRDHVPPTNRPVPIQSFELRLDGVPTRTIAPVAALWTDNAGCRHSIVAAAVDAPRHVEISMEQLPCNDRDFSLSGTVDETGTVIEGRCLNGGPNCTFRMTRR